MASRDVVGRLVELYYELDDKIGFMEGNVPADYITELRNLQITLDELLANISKRWAQGNKTRGYVKIKHIHEEENPNIVRVGHRHL